MYLQMLGLWTREDVTFVRTGRGRYGGRILIVGARSVIPSGDYAKAIEIGGPVIGADILHTGQSTQLRIIISLEHLQGVRCIPVTLELDDECSIASGFCPHCIIAFEAQPSSRQRQRSCRRTNTSCISALRTSFGELTTALVSKVQIGILPVFARIRKR
jgi:hypothetical protein